MLKSTLKERTAVRMYPYGRSAYRAAASGGDLSLKRYRFTGKERDEETGLDYFGVRYYAAWLGRWTSGDPGGFVDGLNLYRYVRNNPVNGVDLEGYMTEPVEPPKQGKPTNPLGNPADEIVVSANKNVVSIGDGMLDAVIDPVKGSEEEKHLNEALTVPEFAEQYNILRLDKNYVFKFVYSEGGTDEGANGSFYAEGGEDERGRPIMIVEYSLSKGNGGIGTSPLGFLFEEVKHGTYFLEKNSGLQKIDGAWSLKEQTIKETLENESQAWLFAAVYAPNPFKEPYLVEANSDSSMYGLGYVRHWVQNSLTSQIRSVYEAKGENKALAFITQSFKKGFNFEVRVYKNDVSKLYDFDTYGHIDSISNVSTREYYRRAVDKEIEKYKKYFGKFYSIKHPENAAYSR